MTQQARVMAIVATAAAALFTGCQPPTAESPGGVTKLQVPGDPPITIGDGSFHAHSQLDWISPDLSSGMIIRPKATSGAKPGSFSAGGPCAFKDKNKTVHNAAAFLWTDEENLYDISPTNLNDTSKWSIVITHNNHVVTVSVVSGFLQIASDSGGTLTPKKPTTRVSGG